MPSAPLTWVVGAGGLLGQHVVTAAAARGGSYAATPVPWGTAAAGEVLATGAHGLIEAAARADRDWQVVWAAGAGVTSTGAAHFTTEIAVFGEALAALADAARRAGSSRRGAVFLASSAGGVYGGVPGAPHDETSPVRAISPYGEAKLAMEQTLATWSAEAGIDAVAGRIANLYGPGQNLAKAQGLISQMCWHDLLARPLSIYVPLDTIRDYIYAPDAAQKVLDTLDAVRSESTDGAGPGEPVHRVKVLCSGQAVAIAEIIGTLRQITRRRPRLILASRPAAAYQSLNLALRSVVYPQVDARPTTTLLVGMATTRDDLAVRLSVEGAPH